MDYVILCVGTDKLAIDCFAPVVGTLLKSKNIGAYVYGSVKSSVNALNIESALNLIKRFHSGSKLIVVDTKITNNGKMKTSFKKGSITVGALSCRKTIGDYHLTFDLPLNKINQLDIKDILTNAEKAVLSLVRFVDNVVLQ